MDTHSLNRVETKPVSFSDGHAYDVDTVMKFLTVQMGP